MESSHTTEFFNSNVNATSGSSDSGGDHTSTATSPSLSSWPSAESSVIASLAGVSDSPLSMNNDASAFFSNKGDVTGVFVGLSVLILSIVGIVYVRGIRKRQKYSKKRNSQDTIRSNPSVTFSALMRRLDGNSAYQTSESPQKLAVFVEQTVTRSPPLRISRHSLSEWWIRRKEKRASQPNSHGPSVIDSDVRRLGEETQWTLGKDLEDQRQRVVTPPSRASVLSVSHPSSHSPRRYTRGPSLKSSGWSRGGRSILESEGGDFTLEDAFSSLHVVYELGSSRNGRHPYARAQG